MTRKYSDRWPRLDRRCVSPPRFPPWGLLALLTMTPPVRPLRCACACVRLRPWGLLAWFTMAGPDVHTETVSFAALLTLGAHPALACRVANGTTAYRN